MKVGMKLLAAVFFVVFCGAAMAQSLGDVAKQKPIKKATRVVTNDDIPSKPAEEAPKAPNASSASDGNSESAPKDQPDAQAASDDKKDPEPPDSPEMAALKKKLADMDSAIATRKKRTEDYKESLKTESDDNKFAMKANILAGMESDLQSLSKERSDIQKEIDNLKEKEKQKASDSEKPDGQ